jgi:hypothetical protein
MSTIPDSITSLGRWKGSPRLVSESPVGGAQNRLVLTRRRTELSVIELEGAR